MNSQDRLKTPREERPLLPEVRKRVALFNGACGVGCRILIQGQVADFPVTPDQKEEVWDPLLSLPPSMEDLIRPFTDFGMKRIRRPRISLQILVHPGRNVTPELLEKAPLLYSSKTFLADKYGFFSHAPENTLEPGHYTVRVTLHGVQSFYQKFKDILRRKAHDRLKDTIIGYGKVRILPDDYDGYIITSDIDQTFLDTDLKTKRGLLETLFETPDKKRALPGMSEFYRQIRKDRRNPIPLLFISSSPHFFRRTFQALFKLHGIDYTGLSLKFFKRALDTFLGRSIQKLLQNGTPYSGTLSRMVDAILMVMGNKSSLLFKHIGYKLTILLENRLRHPTRAKELLIGDNTESDYLIFNLYQLILSGKLQEKGLRRYLKKIRFLDIEQNLSHLLPRILELSRENLKIHGEINPVEGIWINEANPRPGGEAMLEEVRKSLPQFLREDPDLKKTVPCQGAVGFALSSLDKGLIGITEMRKIWKEVLRESTIEEGWNPKRFRKVVRQHSFEKRETPRRVEGLTGE